ncbi:MAG: hypothetical protein ACLGSA_07380 [Acidobacteriota bacterium]
MSDMEDLDFRAFDPPFLGIPDEARFSGKAFCAQGRFVEVFLDMEEATVRNAGFLTDIPHEGMLCASFWCEAVIGMDTNTIRAMTVDDLLKRFPSGFPPPRETARLCLEAGRLAATNAENDTGR